MFQCFYFTPPLKRFCKCSANASGESIVALCVRLSRCVCVSVCLTAEPRLLARRISLGDEGNALYPVLSSLRRSVVLNALKSVLI